MTNLNILLISLAALAVSLVALDANSAPPTKVVRLCGPSGPVFVQHDGSRYHCPTVRGASVQRTSSGGLTGCRESFVEMMRIVAEVRYESSLPDWALAQAFSDQARANGAPHINLAVAEEIVGGSRRTLNSERNDIARQLCMDIATESTDEQHQGNDHRLRPAVPRRACGECLGA